VPMYVDPPNSLTWSPDGVNQNDWIAVKRMSAYRFICMIYYIVVDLFSELSVLCNAVSEFCTEEECPLMKAGKHHEYAWADPSSPEYSSPVLVSAPKYMELLMTWVEKHITSVDASNTNAGSFSINNRIFSRRLFRVYAHIFSEHSENVLPIQHHLHFSLMHFLVFINEFDMMVNEAEIEPIMSVINSLCIPNLHFRL
jgi:MOB kinase activator 1